MAVKLDKYKWPTHQLKEHHSAITWNRGSRGTSWELAIEMANFISFCDNSMSGYHISLIAGKGL